MAKQDGWKFGWKRKMGADISKSASTAFEKESKDDEDELIKSGDIDWLTMIPTKKQVISLEDSESKAHRLTQEGTTLAEAERYWEALQKWDEALQYIPGESKLYEMKAQALMELCEAYPAVHAAKKAVQYSPTWWVAHQTLGRALLGLGEVRQAVRSFSQAVHLNPADEELRQDDLKWAWSLLQKREALDEEKKKAKEEAEVSKYTAKITEMESDEDNDDDNIDNGDDDDDEEEEEQEGVIKTVDIYRHEIQSEPLQAKLSNRCRRRQRRKAQKIPKNYIQMRDPT